MDIYIPKGGMCAVCQHKDDDCSHFTFEQMIVLDVDACTEDNTITVRCPTFANPNSLLHVPQTERSDK